MELDLEPYTVEGIAKREAESDLRKSEALRFSSSQHPPEYYQYRLSGIVVHTGTADGGHYYSFIKERVPLHGDTCLWFEFNDSSVTPFDIKVGSKSHYCKSSPKIAFRIFLKNALEESMLTISTIERQERQLRLRETS
jgi:ubiquitin C-terminal hydrolase